MEESRKQRNSMTRTVICCTLLIAALMLVVADARSEEILDNNTIVRMISAGLAPDVVELKVERTTGHYDLSAEGLIALKNAGVPDRVIKAMLLKGASAPPAAEAPPPRPVPQPTSIALVPAPAVAADFVCADVRYFTLGNDGWAWVPANVCAGPGALVIDQQRIPFGSVVAQCREKSMGLSIGSDQAEWWFSDGKDTYKFRGSARAISDLEGAATRLAPSIPHGSCSDRLIRRRLAGRE
jgi:hypothetical protein